MPFGNSNIHDIHLTENRSAIGASERISFEDHFANWVLARRDMIEKLDSNTKYPIYFMIGEGGGSRAAYWSNLVLSHLQDNTNYQFSNHLFLCSTVSGSTTGTSAFLTRIKEFQDQSKEETCVLRRFGDNFF